MESERWLPGGHGEAEFFWALAESQVWPKQGDALSGLRYETLQKGRTDKLEKHLRTIQKKDKSTNIHLNTIF